MTQLGSLTWPIAASHGRNTLARAYYVDVRLVKSASGANPGVKKIMLTDSRFETP